MGEGRGNLSLNIGRRIALRHFLDAAIGQCDVNLIHVRGHLEGETLSLSAVSRPVKARRANREQVETSRNLELNQRNTRKPGEVRVRGDQSRLVCQSRRID